MSLTEEAKSIVERLETAAFNNRAGAAKALDVGGHPLDFIQISGKRAIADMHDETADIIRRLSKELADAKVNACAEDCLELNQQNARLTKRVEELENGLSMETAPLDGTAILLRSETGSLNIGWRSGDAWSYGGGQWADKLVIRWWPLPAPTLLQSKANSEGGGQ